MESALFIPMLVIIMASIMYHNLAKITPPEANAFLSLAVAYGVATLMTLSLYLISGPKIGEDFFKLNPGSYLLGLAVVGIELGYIFLYRSGFKISSGSLIANISVAMLLLLVGAVLYKEPISLKQILGIVLCLGGLFFIKG